MAQNTPTQPALNWTIVGQGAIGSLAACHLKQAGYPLSLWLRQPRPLQIHFAGQQLEFLPSDSAIDAVLIPVKSYALLDAVHQLLPHLSANAQIVLSHNGMGTIDAVLPLLQPGQGLWFLTTTHGAFKQGASLQHTGKGQSVLAALNRAAAPYRQAVLQAMDAALGPVTLTEDITPFLWQKLAINAAINPLTALYNCRNGELRQTQFQSTLAAVLQEVCQVASACGVALDQAQLQLKLQQVLSATAENYSSMQQDIAHKRRTEIDAINGYVVRQAARFAIAVPHNSALFEQVLQRQLKVQC